MDRRDTQARRSRPKIVAEQTDREEKQYIEEHALVRREWIEYEDSGLAHFFEGEEIGDAEDVDDEQVEGTTYGWKGQDEAEREEKGVE